MSHSAKLCVTHLASFSEAEPQIDVNGFVRVLAVRIVESAPEQSIRQFRLQMHTLNC